MNKKKLVVIICAVLVILVAIIGIVLFLCFGTKKATVRNAKVSTVLFLDDGSVYCTSIEEFDQDYYSKSELEEFINKKVKDFNSSNGSGSIKVDKFTVKDGKAKVIMEYKDQESYSDFNGYEGEVTKIGDFDLSTIEDGLFKQSDNKKIDLSDIDCNKEYYVLAYKFDEDIDVILDKATIYYYGGSVEKATKSKATVGSDGMAYIIYK